MGRLLDLARNAAAPAPHPSVADGRHALPDPAAEARRRRVLAMLTERPGNVRAVYCDGRPVNGVVILTVGIRHAGGIITADLAIPADRYDGARVLDLIERHGDSVH